MSGISLDKSVEKLVKTYIGKCKDGIHQLDRSKMDTLEFDIALFRLGEAFKNKEITEEEFINKMLGE